ncbi:MAG: hypothetical protein J5814_05525 [Bacteroidaceae bacterium]|nr:hypothetical protein [Bacteroidaceae bacterium]
MKHAMKSIVAVVTMMVVSASAFAQYDFTKSSLHVGYTKENCSDVVELSSKLGIGAQFNEAFEIFQFAGNRLALGLDTSFDVNYSKFDEYGTIHMGEVGVQVGPAITIRPIDKLSFRVYAKIAPTFVMQHLVEADKGYANLGLMSVCGASLSYGRLGVGVEQRGGNVKFREIRDSKLLEGTVKSTDFVGPRAYILLWL